MTLEEKVLVRRLFVMRRAQELQNVTEACRQLGISRTLFYRWSRRYLRYGADGLKPRPPRRARPRQQTPAAVEAAVLSYARLWPTHGPARIAQQLTRPGGPVARLSPSGAYAILKRHGLSSRWERLARTEVHGAATLGLLTERSATRCERPARPRSTSRRSGPASWCAWTPSTWATSRGSARCGGSRPAMRPVRTPWPG